MKNNYIHFLLFGIILLTINKGQSQNILFDGDFSLTTEIIPFDTPTPPINTWAYWVNYLENGSEANPTVVNGVCDFQIINAGNNTWDVQLAQWGFTLIQGHSYQLLFDVKAEADRSFGVFLGEEGGEYFNLIGYDRYFYNATTQWLTHSIEFEATSVFALHKLSFELGTNAINIYFDNVILQDLGPAPPEKVVIAGTFQSALNCAGDWDPNCDYTALTFNSSTGLYTGTFQIPEGNHRYKVTVGGSWDINYGENGIMGGADIFLCVTSDSEEITFTYDPATNLVTTSPVSSGFSPDCLPLVVLAGSFQDELGCDSYWVPDCTNTALIYNSDSGLFEGNFNIPTGCYYYRVVLDSNWQNSFGQEGMHNGQNYIISIPANPEITHFAYDPVSHIVSSTPYSGAPQEVTQVSLVGTFQDESGCASDFDYECPYPALLFNPESSAWEGSFTLPAGCYTYVVKETFGCDNVSFFGENGIEWGDYIQLYVPSDGEISFSYDPQTHIIRSTPYSGAPQEVTQVSLYGTFQDELGCAYDYENECDKPALVFNADSGAWEGTFTLPAGCYSYVVKETFGCIATLYGENGDLGGSEIQIYVPLTGEISFSYDPETHILSSTPYSGVPQELTKVSLIGNLQDELGCTSDFDYECDQPALVFNPDSGVWAGSFTLPAGCYSYRVKETSACNVIIYGENGYEGGTEIQLYVPSDGEITFSYDPQTHIMSSAPYSGVPQEVTRVSLIGSVQYELGCAYDGENECEKPALLFDPDSGLWTGSFTLPAGCYSYRVKETFGCTLTFYGENGIEWGEEIRFYVPEEGEITFSYDPQTHIINSTPDNVAPQEVTTVSLQGTLQNELGCASDYEYGCDHPALIFSPDSGTWEGSFRLPAGCYEFLVKETFGCNNITFYGENGNQWGNAIQLYIPSDEEITFSYNPQTHIVTSTPYSGAPQEVMKVSLIGTLQDELGCAYDNAFDCDKPSLEFNAGSGAWEGIFTIPAGCYTYRVKETFGCIETHYGENGVDTGIEIQLYVPLDGEITFSYDPQTHIISSTPYSGGPQELTKVSLLGSLQDELGCAYDYENECDSPGLEFNSGSGAWEGSFTLPAGCYTYRVKETSVCNVTYYGENGIEWGSEIQLFVPIDSEITFSYDPQTHIMISTPYSDAAQELTSVSLFGTLQDELGCSFDFDYECDNPALQFNSGSGTWEGTFTLPAGCYTYYVKEKTVCNDVTLYGETGIEGGNEIQLYVPLAGEITFIYDPRTHTMSSTPYNDPKEIAIKVSLIGTLQDELGCSFDLDFECDNPALLFNTYSGEWEGSFTLPAGCYSYLVRETFGCDYVFIYGENGIEGGSAIELYVPAESEITFSYDPQTHILTSTPYSGAPQDVTAVSFYGTLQDELGCANDFEFECDSPALQFNTSSGAWEGSFTLPAGCYIYLVKEKFGCNNVILYGENGIEWGNAIQLYVPLDGEITFSYDPLTHIMSTTPYTDISTVNQCPDDISVNNSPGICGAVVTYPEFVATADCGGEIISILQTEGLASGSLFPVGVTSNTFLLTKTTGEQITCSFDVVVIDTESPVISNLNQNYEPLWPANHKMVPVFIDYLASDNCNIATTVLSVTSNEPENGLGDGDQAPDWEILDEHNVLLRAERSGKGNGREYYITIKVTDSSGNFTEQIVTVTVPHDKGKKTGEVFESELSNNKYILYPNAADDIINIKGPKSTSNSSYAIYDMLGVWRKQGKINNDQIEVISLPSGVYILKFEVDKEYIFKKFIKN